MKIFSLLIGIIFFTSAIASEYEPLEVGKTITYNVYEMTGAYNDSDMRISVTNSTYVGKVKITLSANEYNDYVTKKLYVRYYHGETIPSTPIIWSSTLQDAKWIRSNNVEFIGEMINELGNTIIPPEPKITKNPIAGESFTDTSIIRASVANTTIINPAFKWKYRTIEYLPTAWGGFVDCWRTGLREYNPNGTDRVYNYLFMKNKGMVNFWYGNLNGNIVTGHQFYAIDY
jgi:hypothetical protein